MRIATRVYGQELLMFDFSPRNLWLICLAFSCLFCRNGNAQIEKLPQPSEDQRLEVMKVLQEVYKPDYLAAESLSKVSLGCKDSRCRQRDSG